MLRKSKVVYVVTLVLSITVCFLSFAACKKDSAGGGNATSLSDRLSGFTVKSEDIAEIGAYYTPEMPVVTLDGEAVHVTLSVSESGKELFLDGDGNLLIESFSDKILTYTVSENGEIAEKTTTVKVTDTSAPQVVADFPIGMYRDETLVISDYMRVVDLSGENITPVVSAKDDSGNIIEITDGKITLGENSMAKKIILAVSASDSHDNTVNESFEIPVRDRVQYNHPFAFDVIDTDRIVAGNTRTTVEEPVVKDGKNAIKVNFVGETWEYNKYYLNIRIKLQEDLANYTKYDSIKVTVSAETNCDIQFYGTNNQTIGRGDTTVHEIAYDMQKVRENNSSVIKEGSLVLNVRMNTTNAPDPVPATMQATLYVYDIEFSYAEKTVIAGNEFDVIEQLGLLPDEITGATFAADGGNTATIVDITSFVPSASGKLSFSVKKDGYSLTDLSVDINVIREPLYGHLVDFNDIDMSLVRAYNDQTLDLQKVDLSGGKQGISFAMNHVPNVIGQDSQGNDKYQDTYFGIKFEKPEWLSYFDTVTVSAYIEQETDIGNVANVTYLLWGKTDVTILENQGDELTVTVPVSHDKFNPDGTEICFYWKVRQNKYTASATFVITDISFGKTVVKGNKLNIAQGLGLETAEIESAYYTQNGGTKIQIDDYANFEPKASGQLDITVNKSGYQRTDLSVYVTVTLPEGQLVNFDDIDMSQIREYNTKTLDLKRVDYNGKQAISVSLEQTAEDAAASKGNSVGIRIAKPAWYDDYDFVTVTTVLYSKDLKTEIDSNFYVNEYDTRLGTLRTVGTPVTKTVELSSATWLINGNDIIIYFKQSRTTAALTATFLITDIQFSKTVSE